MQVAYQFVSLSRPGSVSIHLFGGQKALRRRLRIVLLQKRSNSHTSDLHKGQKSLIKLLNTELVCALSKIDFIGRLSSFGKGLLKKRKT